MKIDKQTSSSTAEVRGARPQAQPWSSQSHQGRRSLQADLVNLDGVRAMNASRPNTGSERDVLIRWSRFERERSRQLDLRDWSNEAIPTSEVGRDVALTSLAIADAFRSAAT